MHARSYHVKQILTATDTSSILLLHNAQFPVNPKTEAILYFTVGNKLGGIMQCKQTGKVSENHNKNIFPFPSFISCRIVEPMSAGPPLRPPPN